MIKKLLMVAAASAAAFFLVMRFSTPPPVDQASVEALLQDNHAVVTQRFQPVPVETEKGTYRATGDDPQIDEFAMGLDDRKQTLLQTLRDRLRQAQDNPGNLQAFFNALRQHCKEQACDTLLAEILADYPDRNFAALVQNIHARMPHYEAAMQATLGQVETEAMFGQEAAWADYQFRYAELMQRAATLSPDERLNALDALRAESFGDYQQSLEQVEGTQGAYERELALLLTDVEDDRQRAEITHQLRVTHFGETQAEILAQRDVRIQHQEAKVADYRASVESLKEELAPLQSSLPANEWTALYESRLEQLRLQHFPAD